MNIKKNHTFGVAMIMVALVTFIWSCGSATGKKGQEQSGSAGVKDQQRAEVARQSNNHKEKQNMKPIELTSDEFKKKVMDFDQHPNDWKFEGDKPAIVDFYATWCGPCKATAPIMDQLAVEYAGKIDFYKVDIDQQQDVAAAFNVQSIPTILFIPKKGEPNMSVGAMMKNQFENIIQKQLLK
ncbi:hypothetical protein LPYR103PRE_18130 [Segatella asaccharophila]|jgi:thioredoxin